MDLFNRKISISKKENDEPKYSYFINAIGSSEHTHRQSDVSRIHSHLLREHSVKDRLNQGYYFKGKAFIPAAIVLQGIKTVINFHTAYLVGNPVTITGTPKAVEMMNKYYRKGTYSKIDWQILTELITYGNAFEYVYLDENGVIKSKVFKNKDSYPIYDENNEYRYFVEYWKTKNNGSDDEHLIVYFPTHIDEYKNGILKNTKVNLTGLPIHYVAMDKGYYDQFGDSMVNDLIPIQDKVEYLLSKLDDAITTLSLNPIGVMNCGNHGDKDATDTNIVGTVMLLNVDGDFKYVTAQMDYNCIKYELDQLYQQFNLVAAIPSSILGQNNIANVSENSMSMVYQLTANRGKQNANALIDGFKKRWAYMRKLMTLKFDPISDDDFDSLDITYNINKPTDTKIDFENMQIQVNAGALSKRTFMERSQYSTNTAQELQRLLEEGVKVIQDDVNENFVADNKETT